MPTEIKKEKELEMAFFKSLNLCFLTLDIYWTAKNFEEILLTPPYWYIGIIGFVCQLIQLMYVQLARGEKSITLRSARYYDQYMARIDSSSQSNGHKTNCNYEARKTGWHVKYNT